MQDFWEKGVQNVTFWPPSRHSRPRQRGHRALPGEHDVKNAIAAMFLGLYNKAKTFLLLLGLNLKGAGVCREF